MSYFNEAYSYYCGIDLHARRLYACIIDCEGNVVEHRRLLSNEAAFLELIEPYRDQVVVGAECVFCWYWLADACQREGIRFVLGHALYMDRIHNGKTKTDKRDSANLAGMLRSGSFPLAYAYPSRFRATRDLVRRRRMLVRQRSEAIVHIRQVFMQRGLAKPPYNLKRKSERDRVLDCFVDEPVLAAQIAIDLETIRHREAQIKAVERFLVEQTEVEAGETLRRLQTIDGIGKTLAMTLLYEIEQIERFPRVQDFVSYCRLVKPVRRSDGKATGGGGKKKGNQHLRWAIGEAVTFMLKKEELKRYKDRLQGRYGKGKALSILSAKLGRCIYYMLTNQEDFSLDRFLGKRLGAAA